MKKVILVLVALTLFLLGCVSQSSDQSNTPISTPPLIQQKVETTETGATKTTDTNPIFETVTIEDENGTAKITKNLITKTADVDYQFYTEKSEYWDSTIFGTLMLCGIFQQIFYDPQKFDEWVTEWNQNVAEWNQTVDGNSTENTEEPNETTTAGSVNQKLELEGYTVTNLNVKAIDREDNQKVGECTVTGKEENQRQITFYGKYAADYEEFKKNNSSDENSTN